MKCSSLFSAAVGLLSILTVDASPFRPEQHGISRRYEMDRAIRYSKQDGSHHKIVRDLKRLDHQLARRYLQKRVFIAGAEDGPKELGLESQAHDPVKSLADSKKTADQLAQQRQNDKGGKWEKVDGKWKETSGAIKNGPSREETIKELPGLVPGTRGSDRFEQAWKDSEPGKITKDGKKTSYQKSMPGPDAMSDQALNNYSKKMYEDGNKKAKEQGMPDHSNMAAAGFSQKPTVAEWDKNSRDKFRKDEKGKYIQGPDSNIHKDTKSPIDMSLTSKGPGSPPLSNEYQTGVDKAAELQKQQALKEKDTRAKKNGETREKERWKPKTEPEKSGEAEKDGPKTDKQIKQMEQNKRKPKMGAKPEKVPPKKDESKCSHTTGGNCAEKGTLPKANKDSSGDPAPGSVSAAYGQAAARPGHKPDLMNNDPPSDKPGVVGTHPGCSGKDPKIGCDKVLEHNKVKDVNGQSPGTQDAKMNIPKGNTANKAKDLTDKLGGGAEFKKLPSHKTDQNGKPVEHRVPKGSTDKKPDDWELPPKTMSEKDKAANAAMKEQAMKKTTELAQAREKTQKGPPTPQTQEQKKAEADRIIKESKEANKKSQSKILTDKQPKNTNQQKQTTKTLKERPAPNKKTKSESKPAGKENKEPAPKSQRKKEKSAVKQEAKANEKKYSNNQSSSRAPPKASTAKTGQSKSANQTKQPTSPSKKQTSQKQAGQQKSTGQQGTKPKAGAQTQQAKQSGQQSPKNTQAKQPAAQKSQSAPAKQSKAQAQTKQGNSATSATQKTNNKPATAAPKAKAPESPKSTAPKAAAAPAPATSKPREQPKVQTSSSSSSSNKKKGKRDLMERRNAFAYDQDTRAVLETRAELALMQSWIVGMMRRSLIESELDEYIWVR